METFFYFFPLQENSTAPTESEASVAVPTIEVATSDPFAAFDVDAIYDDDNVAVADA